MDNPSTSPNNGRGLAAALTFYLLVAACAVVLFLIVRWFGETYVAPAEASPTAVHKVTGEASHALPHLLGALIAVIVLARLLALVLDRLGQPRVIAEVIAGILLGPSLLGIVWPDAMEFL